MVKATFNVLYVLIWRYKEHNHYNIRHADFEYIFTTGSEFYTFILLYFISIFISTWRIVFSICCKADLVMKSLCFCWFGTTLISTLPLKDNFAENGILSGQVCSFDILNVCLLSPLACKLSVQKTAMYLGSFVCDESTFLFILSKSSVSFWLLTI